MDLTALITLLYPGFTSTPTSSSTGNIGSTFP